jgi:hypothetical protein
MSVRSLALRSRRSSVLRGRRAVRQQLLIVIMGVIGGLGGLVGSHHRLAAPGPDRPVGELLLALAATLFLCWMVILVHELGHVLAGRIAGFRFLLLIAGPLKVVREGTSIRFRFNRNVQLAGGIASSVPLDSHGLCGRMALMTAAGPLASLLLLLLLRAGAVGLSDGSSLAAEVLGIGAVISGGVGLFTLLPIRSRGFYNDGARLLMLARGGAVARRWVALAALTGLGTTDQRPRDWDSDLLRQVRGHPDRTVDHAYGLLLSYYAALDMGEEARAGTLIDELLGILGMVPSPVRAAMLTEAAFFSASHRGDAPLARMLLERAQNGLVERHVRLRAEAALLHAMGRPGQASARAGEAINVLREAGVTGLALAEAAWLQMLADPLGSQ